ncbi:hypothetical protein SEA_SCHWARTZ33_39 [Gordonia phage Schwartz33]|nr:hypothetical protein SEA_SCHWARTZ33_39 [Gordonia phage Schwartz33]
MNFDFDQHLEDHLNGLAEAVRDNKSIMRKLNDNPASITIDEMVELRDRLESMEVNITLLNKAHDVYLEERKTTKRRFYPFKK